MRTVRAACIVVASVMLLPSAVLAQATITGAVKDASGAVLPGVTVEASSPALIEKSRVATTDGSGQYRIIDLRQGTYSVTFTLPGFSTVKREGIELPGSFTAVINAELKVGALEETVIVTGETPIVDVQSVRRQTTISNDVITSIPGARAYAGLMTLMPSTVTAAGSASDIQVVPGMVVFGSAGGRGNEGRLQVDGLSVGSAFNGAGVSSYIPDVSNSQEVTMTTSGGLGEAEVGGPALNVVPKTGGNSLHGSLYASGVTEGLVGSNYTPELKARGLSTPGKLTKVWDFNGGIGGPIVKNRIWYYGVVRHEGSYRTVPGMFANLNAGDPTKWTYAPDTSRPAVLANSVRSTALRLTIQATPKNKFGAFWDEQSPCEGGAYPGAGDDLKACRHSGDGEIIGGASGSPAPAASATLSPEAGSYRAFGSRVQQLTWTSTATNRLLLDAGLGTYMSRWGGSPIPGANTQDLIRVTENCARGCAYTGNIPNLTYRSGNWASNWQEAINWRASISHVAGNQSRKFGYQGGYLIDSQKSFTNNTFLAYRTQNGIPDQLTETINAFPAVQRVRYDALYAQEAWTLHRVTLQGALRFDHAWSFFPEATIGPVRFLPTATTFPRTKGVDSYKDLTPRMGAAIDVFGNGKTSVKLSAGRYLEAAQNGGNYSASRPTSRVQTSTTRTWTDTNRNFVADCDLLNPLSQDLSASGGDFCGQISNLSFGKPVFSTTQDPALLAGWGVRAGDWQYGASIQQELMPRVSVEFGYFRRWLQNFTVTDNLSQAPSDFGTFSVVAPSDPRLPGGGGYTIGNLYNANQNVASVVNNLVTNASNYGDQYQKSHSFNMNVTARPGRLVVQGGFNTSKTTADRCDITADVPESNPVNPYCHTETAWVTRLTGLGTYTVPKIEVQFAATFRSDQGAELAANWAAPNAVIQPSLGRPLSNSAPNATINLITPGTLYGDRVNELDFRLAKILKFGRTRTNVGVDFYNVLNSAAILTYNQTFVPNGNWLGPTSILQPRFLKLSAQIDF